MVTTESKSNFSFIVALAGRGVQQVRPLQRAKEEQMGAERVLHSLTVLDLEQYHAITERSPKELIWQIYLNLSWPNGNLAIISPFTYFIP